MAITKLMHMKEAPDCPHDHLRNAIDYILDVKHGGAKTEGGVLVGGNSGLDNKEILENFLETKREYGKTDGRQGYHFVISFAKGETDEATAYEVIREFCEQYLGDAYDYVFAVHNDKEHMHGHIIFNSVSRMDGYKYHYKKGDWEKSIQPITDRICVEHNLSPLTFEEERTGVSYASWISQHEGKCNWTHIICADVDYAIQQASSGDEFLSILKKMNYQLKMGHSRKHHADYITFKFVSPDGKEHKRRSYNMPPGYSPQEILQRIQTKEGSRTYEEIIERLSGQAAEHLKPTILKSTQTYKRLYQAVSYYKLPNPFAVPAYQVRKDMIHIEKLLEECRYLSTNHLKGKPELENRMALIDENLKRLLAERKKLYGLQNGMDQEQLAYMGQYENLQKRLTVAGTKDSRFEEIEDEMKKLESMFPDEMLETGIRIRNLSRDIADARKEKRIVGRILKSEEEREANMRTEQEPQIRK